MAAGAAAAHVNGLQRSGAKPPEKGGPEGKRPLCGGPFLRAFLRYKEIKMNTHGFSLVREERLSEVSGTVKLWRHAPPARSCSP